MISFKRKPYKDAIADIQRDFDIDKDQIEFIRWKLDADGELTDRDKEILQTGWPWLHGELGGKFYYSEKELVEDRFGISGEDFERALDNLYSNDPMTKENIRIIQEVYPEEFGIPGEEFIDIKEIRGQKPQKTDISEDKGKIVIKEKKDKEGLRYPTGRYEKGSSLVYKYVKDRRGKDFLDYVKDARRKTGCSTSEVEKAVEKVYSGQKLTDRQKKILQSGWPHIYGKVGTKFKLPSKFSELIITEEFKDLSECVKIVKKIIKREK